MGRRTLVSEIWSKVDELQVLVKANPTIPPREVRAVANNLEEIVKRLRRKELRERKVR